jgi:hypothetical protein
MTDSTGIAVDAIRTIYDLWRVDEDRVQWAGDPSPDGLLRQGYGFDWWPGKFKIQVRASGPHPEIEVPIYRISVRTDLLCDVDVTTEPFKQALSGFNHGASTFAVCAYPTDLPKALRKYGPLADHGVDLKSSIVWLSSTAYVHEGRKDWLPPVFTMFATLQFAHAQFAIDLLAESLGGRADHTAPPGRALPTNVHGILQVLKSDILPAAERPSRWIGTGELEEIVVRWQNTDFEYSLAFEGAVAVETSFGQEAALIMLRTDSRNAFLGNGLDVYLKLPYLDTREAIHALAIEMNFLEDRMWSKPGMPFIGGWSAEQWGRPGQPGFGPMFSCFIPNAFYQHGLAEILVMDAIARAAMFRKILLPGVADAPMEEIQRRLHQREAR